MYRPVNKITVQGVIYCMKYFFVLFLLLAAPAHALDHLQVVKTATRSHIKISLPRSLRPVLICQADDDDGDDDQLDVQVAYRRPDLIENSELSLSDYVKLRLDNARRLALLEHHKHWG